MYTNFLLSLVCGTRPWFKDPTLPRTYANGVRNGISESRIGSSPKRTPYDGGLSSRVNSVRRHGRHISFGSRGAWGSREGRIVNGMTADYGEWPWQVSLRQWRTGVSENVNCENNDKLIIFLLERKTRLGDFL